MKVFGLLLVSALAGLAQMVSLNGPATAKPGEKVTLTVQFTGTGNAAAAQWAVVGPEGLEIAAPVASPALVAAQKLLHSFQGKTLAVGINSNMLPTGAAASYSVTLPDGFADVAFSLKDVELVALDGTPVAASTGPDVVIKMIRRADLNGDGRVDSVDLLISVNQILGIAECTPAVDLNGDGKCSLLDAQLLIKEAL
jgi:hypothetical protein